MASFTILFFVPLKQGHDFGRFVPKKSFGQVSTPFFLLVPKYLAKIRHKQKKLSESLNPKLCFLV
jgi:hypothetical protein